MIPRGRSRVEKGQDVLLARHDPAELRASTARHRQDRNHERIPFVELPRLEDWRSLWALVHDVQLISLVSLPLVNALHLVYRTVVNGVGTPLDNHSLHLPERPLLCRCLVHAPRGPETHLDGVV